MAGGDTEGGMSAFATCSTSSYAVICPECRAWICQIYAPLSCPACGTRVIWTPDGRAMILPRDQQPSP
jgi:hypothetical protein